MTDSSSSSTLSQSDDFLTWFGKRLNGDQCYCTIDAQACETFIRGMKQHHGIAEDAEFDCGTNGVVFKDEQFVYKVQIGSEQFDYNKFIHMSNDYLLPIYLITLFDTSGNMIRTYQPNDNVKLSRNIVNVVDASDGISTEDIHLLNQSAHSLNEQRNWSTFVITTMKMPQAVTVTSIHDEDINAYIELCMNLAKQHVIQLDAKFQNVVWYDGQMRFIDMDEVCECRAHWRLLFLIMLVHTAIVNNVL
eukprot:scaffold224166_cov40-Tisochrysis_lutea.AAC.1